jgi:hypothetical protein
VVVSPAEAHGQVAALPRLVPPRDVARALVAAAAAGPRGRRLIVVDGPSGAGKSTFADALVARWPRGVELVRLDDVYPGWGGLARGAETLGASLVDPWVLGRLARVPRWDWGREAAGPVDAVRPGRDLVIEGCGAFAAAQGAAALRIWVQAADAARKRAALDRDRGAFDPFWELWDGQWRRYVARTGASAARADLIVTGLST